MAEKVILRQQLWGPQKAESGGRGGCVLHRPRPLPGHRPRHSCGMRRRCWRSSLSSRGLIPEAYPASIWDKTFSKAQLLPVCPACPLPTSIPDHSQRSISSCLHHASPLKMLLSIRMHSIAAKPRACAIRVPDTSQPRIVDTFSALCP